MIDQSQKDTQALLRNSLLKIKELKAQLKEQESLKGEPIALIGVGCRFPAGARGPDDFFQALEEGVDAVRKIPEARWAAEATAGGHPEIQWAALLDTVDGFDAAFFGISPREAARLDPQQRLLLEVAWGRSRAPGRAPIASWAAERACSSGCAARIISSTSARQSPLMPTASRAPCSAPQQGGCRTYSASRGRA